MSPARCASNNKNAAGLARTLSHAGKSPMACTTTRLHRSVIDSDPVVLADQAHMGSRVAKVTEDLGRLCMSASVRQGLLGDRKDLALGVAVEEPGDTGASDFDWPTPILFQDERNIVQFI